MRTVRTELDGLTSLTKERSTNMTGAVDVYSPGGDLSFEQLIASLFGFVPWLIISFAFLRALRDSPRLRVECFSTINHPA